MEPNFKDQEAPGITQPAMDDREQKELLEKAGKYKTVLTNMLHSEKTRDEVVDMLKASKDPFMTVPQAAMSVNDMAISAMKRGGIKVDASVQLASSDYLLDDLIKLGEASGSFKIQEGDKAALFEDTYQLYIERGLKDGSVDPIQLQLEAEQLMNDEQKAAGAMLGNGSVPPKPNQQAIQEQYAQGAVKKDREGQAKKTALANKRQMMQEQSQGGPR